MFRKIFGVSALICAAVLVGCSSGKDEPTAVEPETPAPTEEVTEAPSEEETEPTVRTRIISSIEDFDYEIFEGHAVITSYTGSESEIVIPPEIEGAPVTEIGFYAFEAKYGVTSVELPDSLEIIGQFAFMDCADLQTINIPEKVKEIQRGAFASCTSLGPVVIPKKTAFIREEAFTACESRVAPSPVAP